MSHRLYGLTNVICGQHRVKLNNRIYSDEVPMASEEEIEKFKNASRFRRYMKLPSKELLRIYAMGEY